jgi:L-rhamnonate dehydratase
MTAARPTWKLLKQRQASAQSYRSQESNTGSLGDMRNVSRRGFLWQATGGLAVAAAKPALKITSVRAVPLRVRGGEGSPDQSANRRVLPDFDPRRWRQFGPFSQLGGAILVQIRTDQGITGYGMGGGGGAAVYIIENHLSDLLMGTNPMNIELLWDQMFASTSFYGRRGVAIMAISGIDLALWDIAGKQAGLPVYRLLGGPTKEKVPAYYTGNDIERGLKLGFSGVKISNFNDARAGKEGLRRDADKILAARKTLGPDPLLMIDALCAWDVPYTLELAERVAEARVHFIEEPLLPDDIDGYSQLCREVRGARIASGEHEATRFGFQELIRHKAAHILQPDVTWSGGLTDCRRVAQLGAANGLPVLPHRGGSVYGMSLILCSQAPSIAESFGTGESGNELMELLTSKFEGGFYYPLEGPGFGVEFTSEVLKKYAPGLT